MDISQIANSGSIDRQQAEYFITCRDAYSNDSLVPRRRRSDKRITGNVLHENKILGAH